MVETSEYQSFFQPDLIVGADTVIRINHHPDRPGRFHDRKSESNPIKCQYSCKSLINLSSKILGNNLSTHYLLNLESAGDSLL